MGYLYKHSSRSMDINILSIYQRLLFLYTLFNMYFLLTEVSDNQTFNAADSIADKRGPF